METDFRAWLDSLPKCDVCGNDFLLIKDPILLPCGHRIACGTCLWKQNNAGTLITCSQCQGVSQYTPEYDQVVAQLITQLSAYITSTADDSVKIEAIQRTHTSLQEHISQKIYGLFPGYQEMQVVDPQYNQIEDEAYPPPPETQPLPDLSAIDVKSVFDVLNTPTWTCAVCGEVTNDQSELRCRKCNRVNFQVYQRQQPHSISLPPSLQALFAPKPKESAPIIQSRSEVDPQLSAAEKKGGPQHDAVNEEKKDHLTDVQARNPGETFHVQAASAKKANSKPSKQKSSSTQSCCTLI